METQLANAPTIPTKYCEDADGQKIAMGQRVRIRASGEGGKVVGIAHYRDQPPTVLIHYRNGAGIAVTEWWGLEFVEADQAQGT